MTPGRATVVSPRGTRAHASEELSLLCVTIPEFSCQAVLQVKYPEAICLIVQGGVERCEYVSCIIEAVKHHEYVFLLHAVAAAAVASITSKASGVKGWERERPWRCYYSWCFERGSGTLGKYRERSTVLTLLLSMMLLLNMVRLSFSRQVSR